MGKFEQVTIILLASTEQQTLRETVRIIGESCDAADIAEVIIFLISEDCPPAAVAQDIIRNNPYKFPIRSQLQQIPGLSGGVHEIPRYVKSSHFIITATDMEMDPASIHELIAVSKQHPNAIVCASKFMKGAKRYHYGVMHYLCNRTVHLAMKLICGLKATELMAFFQVYPTELFKSMEFTEPKRTFYQYTIRPILRGAEYIEIPTDYVRRTEGASNFNLPRYIDLAANFLSAAVIEKRRSRKKR